LSHSKALQALDDLRAPAKREPREQFSAAVPRTSVYERLSVSLNESLTNGPTAS
ncbi:hypothetical protein K0M31_004517, partial [Melipona bicolor]